MVGWSRRNAESARANRIAREKYMKWFESLTSEQQLEEIRLVEERERNERPKLIATVVLTIFMMFVFLPMALIGISYMRGERFWQNGKVVSETPEQICKEVEYCRPCAPIHHWHKETWCRKIEKAP